MFFFSFLGFFKYSNQFFWSQIDFWRPRFLAQKLPPKNGKIGPKGSSGYGFPIAKLGFGGPDLRDPLGRNGLHGVGLGWSTGGQVGTRGPEWARGLLPACRH